MSKLAFLEVLKPLFATHWHDLSKIVTDTGLGTFLGVSDLFPTWHTRNKTIAYEYHVLLKVRGT